LRRAYLEYANRGVDGVHDMGGMDGFGQVVEPGGEIVSAERWESRVFAIHMVEELEDLGAGPGARAVREEMPAADYLAASYYERWLFSVERRLERSGAIAPGEVEQMMRRLHDGEPAPTHRDAAMTERMLAGLATVHPIGRPPDTDRFGPEPVYSVAFASCDLWGPSEEGVWTVALDLWESYLEAP
jgi:nitrile hydratase